MLGGRRKGKKILGDGESHKGHRTLSLNGQHDVVRLIKPSEQEIEKCNASSADCYSRLDPVVQKRGDSIQELSCASEKETGGSQDLRIPLLKKLALGSF